MAKAAKTSSKVAREATSGQFVLAKPATTPKRLQQSQIREAVRAVAKQK